MEDYKKLANAYGLEFKQCTSVHIQLIANDNDPIMIANWYPTTGSFNIIKKGTFGKNKKMDKVLVYEDMIKTFLADINQ